MDMNEPRQGRTIVLCFDGTSNQFDGDASANPPGECVTDWHTEHQRRQALRPLAQRRASQTACVLPGGERCARCHPALISPYSLSAWHRDICQSGSRIVCLNMSLTYLSAARDSNTYPALVRPDG